MKWLCVVLALLAPIAEVAHAAERALSLADALALARQRSARVHQADVEVERARLRLLAQKLAWIDLRIEANASSQMLASSPGPLGCAPAAQPCPLLAHRADLTVSLRLPVWTGLRLESELAAARQREEGAQASQRSALRDLQLDVTQAYWEVRRQELTLAVLERLAPRFVELERVTQRRAARGLAPLVDYDRAHAASLAVAAQRIAFAREQGRARAALASLLQLDEPFRLTDDPMRHWSRLPPLDQALRAAAAADPTLAEADATLRAAGAAVRAAQGAFWPQLSLVAWGQLATGDQLYDPSGALPPAPAMASYYVGAQLSWKLFDMMGSWLGVRAAELERTRVAAERERRGYALSQQVRVAHAELAEALSARRPTRQSVALARDDLELLQQAYSAGSAQLLDVLSAQQQLLRAELEQVGHAVDLIEADARLGALGGHL